MNINLTCSKSNNGKKMLTAKEEISIVKMQQKAMLELKAA